MFEYGVRVREKLLEDHPDRLNSQYALAGAYQEDGQVSRAIPMFDTELEELKGGQAR